MLCIFAHSLVGIFRINSSVFELQRFDAQPIQNIASNALYDWMAQSVWFNTMHLIYWRSVCVRSIPSSIMPDQLINVLCTSIPMILLLFSIFFFISTINYRVIIIINKYAFNKFPMVMCIFCINLTIKYNAWFLFLSAFFSSLCISTVMRKTFN